MSVYDTKQEHDELGQIEEKYPDMQIVNPNGAFEIRVIQGCFPVVAKCQRLIFTSIYSETTDPRINRLERFIGKGAYAEIQLAKQMGKPVEWLIEREFVTDFIIRPYDTNDWQEKFAIIYLPGECDMRSVKERYGFRFDLPKNAEDMLI